jgi:type III restriction enzyme
MKISFDASLAYQTEAVKAVVDLFDGQPLASTLFELPGENRQLRTTGELAACGNSPIEDFSRISMNLRKVQELNKIPAEYRLEEASALSSLDFSVEMETGTGKTYVYIRTALELHKRFNYSKFIIVVPSIAIREGVLANLKLLRDHFADIYGGTPYEYRVYNSKHPEQLKDFAQATTLQILVINIDSFNKDQNLIFKERDGTMGVKPIEYIAAVNPIVIIDEPQNMTGESAKSGLAKLAPMVILRYSATHRELTNLVYRLTPVDAYNKKLVKQIAVWSVLADQDLNKPFISVKSVIASKKSVSATVLLDELRDGSIVRSKKILKPDSSGILPDLFDLSGFREIYKGFNVEDILRSPDRVVFGNGNVIEVGETFGTDKDAIQKASIETAIFQSLQTELELLEAFKSGRIAGKIKPLTLIFIDKVANYHPEDSKFRIWFEDEYEKLRSRKDFKELNLPPVEKVHGGYFALSNDRATRGQPKDSSEGETTRDDTRAYELIMQRKDLLMAVDEPMRFIWSHSALREGWDNPNVFTIATLNETKSAIKKRQEIGRGLRIPVLSTGERCQDHEINKLTVIANESYDDFASQLQREIEDETSTKFAKSNIKNARLQRPVLLKEKAKVDEDFKALWKKVSGATSYEVTFGSELVISRAIEILASDPSARIKAPVVRIAGGTIVMSEKDGVVVGDEIVRPTKQMAVSNSIPDLIGRVLDGLAVSRGTAVAILCGSNRLDEVRYNPTEFIRQVRDAITLALEDVLIDGIEYQNLGSDRFLMKRFEAEPQKTAEPESERFTADKSALSEILTDSDTEIAFAKALDSRADVRWFIKLPWWFKVPTPVGNYNPDWAVCHGNPDNPSSPTRICLVRETKGVQSFAELSRDEQLKIRYGKKHFAALGVDFEWNSDGNYAIEVG